MFDLLIAYDDHSDQFFTDISLNYLADYLAQEMKNMRAEVRAGEFGDLAGAMVCLPFDMPIRINGHNAEVLAGLGSYEMAIAVLTNASMDTARSGSILSNFWFDGKGQDILKCRSGKGILNKIYG